MIAAALGSAGCDPVAADTLELRGPSSAVATRAVVAIGVDRLVGSNFTCPVAYHERLGVMGGGGPDTCHYYSDDLELIDRTCDGGACTFEPVSAAAPSTLRLRAVREGSVTLRVRARSRADGKTVDGTFTFTAADAHALALAPLAEGGAAPSSEARLEDFPLGLGMQVVRSVIATSATGKALAGEPEVKSSANVEAAWEDGALTMRTRAAGLGTVTITVGDATSTEALHVVDVGAAPVELHRMEAKALVAEPETDVALTLADGVAFDVPLVACARATGGELAIVVPPSLEVRHDPDQLFEVATHPGSGIVWLDALGAGSAELWAPDHRLATLSAH